MNRFVNKLLDFVGGPEVEEYDSDYNAQDYNAQDYNAQDYNAQNYDPQEYGYSTYEASPNSASTPVSRPSSFTPQAMDAQDYQSLYRAEYGFEPNSAHSGNAYSSNTHPGNTYSPSPVAPPPPNFGRRGDDRSAPPPDNIVNLPGLAQQGAEVMVMAPTYFEEMPAAIAALKARKLVVLNLTAMESDQAQRSVDFLAGGTYTIDGDLERIGENIFLFTPNFVQIRGPQPPAEQAPPAPAVDPVTPRNGWQASPPPWSPAQMQVG